jgi:hypothetical protein
MLIVEDLASLGRCPIAARITAVADICDLHAMVYNQK